MADIQTLKDKIKSTIYPNGKGAINATDHQALLLEMADGMAKTNTKLTELEYDAVKNNGAKLQYGGKAYADIPCNLPSGVTLISLGVATAVYLKKKAGGNINVYSVPYKITEEIIAFQVNTAESGEITIEGSVKKELDQVSTEIESISDSLAKVEQKVQDLEVPLYDASFAYGGSAYADIVFPSAIPIGATLISLGVATAVYLKKKAGGYINVYSVPYKITEEIIAFQVNTAESGEIRFQGNLASELEEIEKNVDSLSRQVGNNRTRIDLLEKQDISNVGYQHGKVVTGYITDNSRTNFFAESSSNNYISYIRKVTPGEKLLIYTDALFGGWDSLAAFTNSADPTSVFAQKINAQNLTLSIGYNELVVPNGATYFGMTLKFSASLGDPEKKIIASYSDYAMVQKIKNLENAKSDTDRDKVKVKFENGKLYLATLWDSNNDLVRTVELNNSAANNNINLYDAFIGKKGTFIKDTLIKSCGDDICPAFVNNSYIGGNHGWNAAKKITVSSHNKTIADVGSVYQDVNGLKFTILQVIDNTTLIVCSENKGVQDNYLWYAPSGSLTYVSNGKDTSSITPVNIANLGNLYGCVVPSVKRVLVDDNLITEEGEYSGDKVVMLESYDVIDLPSILNSLSQNRPAEGYTSQPILYELPGVKKLFNQTIAYTFDAKNTTLVNTTFRAYIPLFLSFHGFTQAGVIGGDAKLYCPKTLPISMGGVQYDFRKITDWSKNPSAAIYLTPSYWENPENAPDRAIMMNADAVFACGYLLDRGKLSEPREGLVNKYAMHFSDNRKLYPMGICPTNPIKLQANEYCSAVAYRSYYNPKVSPKERTNMTVVSVGGITYIYADYHGPIEDYLPAWVDMIGKKIKVLEKTDSCNIYEDVVTGDIRVDSAAPSDGYGYVVLKIE